MPYTYHTDDDRRAMLEALGLESEDDLLDVIPDQYRLRALLPIERGRTEPEVLRMLGRLADRNAPATKLVSFLGGGIYDHTVPSAEEHHQSARIRDRVHAVSA